MRRGELTTEEYWNSTYRERTGIQAMEIAGWRNACARTIFEMKFSLGLEGKSILEVGGGGSRWLALLARKYPNSRFACVDFSRYGIDALADFIKRERIENLAIYRDDFFNPSSSVGKYDIVYSHGVVEHFKDLPGVLAAHGKFLKASGSMLTIIPNMVGLNGLLMKWLNRSVYDIHVLHDLESFKGGHRAAGLKIVSAGYLCSNNFGVLSSCVREQMKFKRFCYVQLSRLSKLVWFCEDALCKLPVTKVFSPYMYVISQNSD